MDFDDCKKAKQENQLISCYMFEFHQGNHPEIFWKYGKQIEFLDDIMWYTVTTPIAQDSKLCSPECSIFVTTFDHYKLYSFYLLVPGVEARGFTRTVCLCVTIDIKTKVINLPKKFIDLIQDYFIKSVIPSYEPFKKEFSDYIGSLIATVKAFPDSEVYINPIINEITPIAKGLNVEVNMNQQPKKPELFNQINNDLRKVESLFDFDTLTEQISSIMNTLDVILPYGNIFELKYIDTKQFLNFGGIYGQNYADYVIDLFQRAEEINSQKYNLISLLKSHVFHHCVNCIFQSIPLVIESPDIQSCKELARKFSIFVPNFTNDCLNQVDKVDDNVITEKHSIIITKHVDRDMNRIVGILNPELGYYEGPLCPYHSIVDRAFGFQTKTDISFLINCLSRLKEIEYKFVAFMFKIKEENSLQDNPNISIFDKQTLSNWNNMMLLSGVSSSIQTVEQIPISWGIVAYY
ncbi:hypothetical protein TVAG_000680 [Trichomonas vaginalis G3]|uniref:UDENN FLCN/SMCR8-type domain-containing protein n=1 Tax=Trichomonas vaginalis (strain ATCC PRA-98 / G3) TaxID=412133 RepID=A2EHU4_TRIV3|nr:hypothetical protein TVAGG3_0076940 [Trichomonas vaginalis G3]EAY07784.1 hypothetical protein TVAG_000680 [Trichomonas vaginalis G3]KAI5542941.1 hypothetical protein TVAGG3_0076940 [Trichomonas vaginalis G3]|eukprot:XP_001320007.1 hypothetical protein [Trichomonas vaginalis G3]